MPAFPAALRVRAALGLHPVTAPVMLYIPAGYVLGPHVTGILSAEALRHLDVVISIALAILGVFIGVAAGREGWARTRLVVAANVEAAVTMAAVGGAVYFLATSWQVPLALPAVMMALLLGVCASASAAPADAPRVAAQVADLDDVLPIVAGTAVLAAATLDTSPHAAVLITVLVGAGAGATGWLLFDRARGPERNVFVIGALALIAGGAAYFGTSPLLAGLIAGWIWAVAPGGADRIVQEDLRKLQHPLVLLMLLIAGAIATPSLAAVWLLTAYVLFRLIGKLTGGWAASRIAPGTAPADLGADLIAPGVIGVAFALNIEQVVPASGGTFAFTIAAGAIASEIVALYVSLTAARS